MRVLTSPAELDVGGQVLVRYRGSNFYLYPEGDTGAMHVAAALGTPVVVPFGSTSPELTGPGVPRDQRHRLLKAAVPCSPCFRRTCPIDFRCMTGISSERVVEAVIDLISASR